MTIYRLFISFSQFWTSSMSSSNYCFLTHMQVCQETSKVVWYSHLIKNLPQFFMIHIVKGLSIINEAEADVFWNSLFLWPDRCWQFDIWFQCVCVCVLSRVQLFVASWMVICQAPLSTEFSRQEYWCGLPFPVPGDQPNPGMRPTSLEGPHWQADSLPLVPSGEPLL